MKSLDLLAAMVGLAAGLVFLLTALRALGQLMNEWAGEAEVDIAPPAEHPYEPNGGPLGAGPTFPASALLAPPYTAAPRSNEGLPGRRKDNAHDRSDAAVCTRN